MDKPSFLYSKDMRVSLAMKIKKVHDDLADFELVLNTDEEPTILKSLIDNFLVLKETLDYLDLNNG